MSIYQNPGMVLMDAENTDGFYGPYRQGNIGTFPQRLPPLFTASCTEMDTAVVTFYQSDTATDTKLAILDPLGNPYTLVAADFTDDEATVTIPNLQGSSFLWLQITSATVDTDPITISIGTGPAQGYLDPIS